MHWPHWQEAMLAASYGRYQLSCYQMQQTHNSHVLSVKYTIHVG